MSIFACSLCTEPECIVMEEYSCTYLKTVFFLQFYVTHRLSVPGDPEAHPSACSCKSWGAKQGTSSFQRDVTAPGISLQETQSFSDRRAQVTNSTGEHVTMGQTQVVRDQDINKKKKSCPGSWNSRNNGNQSLCHPSSL